ncbi:restriction endonuclease subunit S [Demequina sp. NBRC 110051]|uniref:restriction endonuclease subunit S n=1 Tax=Demequina sp. NBRC 110051 TaxID=1570340 RepID=UPI00117F7CE6|nr:hypothetical protein [Demequina sp. NBRC 110051]
MVTERKVKNHPDEPLLAATQSRGVIRKSDFESRTVEATKSLETLKLVEVDDFVISLRSFQGGIERAYARGIISPAYTILRPRRASDLNYLTLLFKSRQFIDALTLTVTGIREGQSIEYPRLARDLVPVPPPDEQAAIVKYLAHAHARIDKAIAAKRRMIALVEEQAQSVIDQAVTRGLASGAHLKDSGVEWLGPIPTDWSIRRAKYVLKPIDVRTATGSEPRLTVSSSLGVVPKGTVNVYMFEAASYVGHKLCWPGDLVINSLWAWGRGLAVSKHHGIVSSAYGVYRLRVDGGLEPDFLNELVRSNAYHRELFVNSRGVWKSRLQLTDDRFLATSLPVPPTNEQHAIMMVVETARKESHAAVALATKQIDLLEAFRARLTSDVVTGQVDVRALAATLATLPVTTLAAGSTGAEESLHEVAEEFLEGEPI